MQPNIINLTINGKAIEAQAGQTIVTAAKNAGIIIPTLCHDERVKPYGACGVCCVEAAGMPKLLRACSTLVAEGMDIQTESLRAVQSRKAALELLLSDHDGDCRPPCALACPAQTDCQGYAALIANGRPDAALALMKDKLPLPASLGRVCPHPCETACRRKHVEEPVSLAFLKAYAADIDLQSETPYIPEVGTETGKTVCVVGGGPGGLTAAYFLRRQGHSVHVVDAMPQMGGMLRYGIPEYRLPKAVLNAEINVIRNMGVALENNVRLGADTTLEALRKQYDAVVLATGAWSSMSMRCAGEDLPGVVGGIDYLRANALGTPMAAKRVAVVGGGNTAMDAVRTAVRLGADEVGLVYRRTVAEMPAEEIEIQEAQEEGVVFRCLTNPIEVQAENGRAARLVLQQMQLGEADASGRRAPVPIDGATETLPVDLVIMAIGQQLNAAGLDGVDLTKRGTIAADENSFRTNLDGVFAVGDATNRGASIAIEAIGEARRAAKVIGRFLQGEDAAYTAPILVERQVTAAHFADAPRQARAKMPHRPADERKHDFKEVNLGFSKEAAEYEASRCLECGCHDYFECKLIRFANIYNARPEAAAGEKHTRVILDDHPFIERNPDKCVLCGLCSRVCEEVMGVTALGLVGRGFDATVKPALGRPLTEAGCVSCGQCVAACPTGALGEKAIGRKRAPLKESLTPSVCGFCGAGCAVQIATAGNSVVRVLPGGEADNKVLLCAKGRFGWMQEAQEERIALPSDTTLGATLQQTVDALRVCAKEYGNAGIAAAFSARLTNEEAAAAKAFMDAAFPGAALFAFGGAADEHLPAVEIARAVRIEDGVVQGLSTGANRKGLQALGLSEAVPATAQTLIVFGDGDAPTIAGVTRKIVFAAYAKSAQGADIAVPLSSFMETSGHVTTAHGQTLQVNAAIASPSQGLLTNIDIFQSLHTK